MSSLRAAWLVIALSWGVIGVAAALPRPAGLLVVAPLFAGLGIVVALLFEHDTAPGADHGPARRLFAPALVGGAGSVAVTGWVALAGPGGLAVALLVAATSPRALRGWGRALSRLPRPTAAQLDGLARSLACTSPTYLPPPAPSDADVLTDDQLCRFWRESGAAVRRPTTRRAWIRAVEERGWCLDQLLARRPGLLGSWLSSDVGQPDDLVRLADAFRHGPTVIDWDQLTGGQATDR